MENIRDFPNRSTIEKDAGEWLIRLDGDEPLTATEIEMLRVWLNRSPVHREELGNLIAFYGKMNILTELAVPLGKPDLHSSANAKIQQRPFSLSRVSAVAAVIVLGMVVTLTSWFTLAPVTATNGLYVTAVGEQQTAVLADGSKIQLNTNSRVKVEYSKGYRNVFLEEGEAYFAVAKEAHWPFRVYADNRRIEAVGTAFVVYHNGKDVNVTVTEGRVALAEMKSSPVSSTDNPPGQDFDTGRDNDVAESIDTLAAGQSAMFDANPDGKTVRNLEQQELNRRLSWRDGLLIFNGNPLEQVIDDISRYTKVTIEIEDPAIRAIDIGGQFRVGDIQGLFDSLEANFGLRVTRLGPDHVQLSAAITPVE